MLSSWDARVLSQAFGLDPQQVAKDAILITASRHLPLDDVIATLRERHTWAAATAYKYLRTLHTAQRGGPIAL